MSEPVPLVECLRLDDDQPYLVANQCTGCGARYFERRNGCGRCGGRTFSATRVADTGVLSAYTVVHRYAKGGPFVSGVFELDDGAVVKANLVGVEARPDDIELGGNVRLTTFPVATDGEGREAIAFGFEPI